jgi:hypothetical protein
MQVGNAMVNLPLGAWGSQGGCPGGRAGPSGDQKLLLERKVRQGRRSSCRASSISRKPQVALPRSGEVVRGGRGQFWDGGLCSEGTRPHQAVPVEGMRSGGFL